MAHWLRWSFISILFILFLLFCLHLILSICSITKSEYVPIVMIRDTLPLIWRWFANCVYFGIIILPFCNRDRNNLIGLGGCNLFVFFWASSSFFTDICVRKLFVFSLYLMRALTCIECSQQKKKSFSISAGPHRKKRREFWLAGCERIMNEDENNIIINVQHDLSILGIFVYICQMPIFGRIIRDFYEFTHAHIICKLPEYIIYA